MALRVGETKIWTCGLAKNSGIHVCTYTRVLCVSRAKMDGHGHGAEFLCQGGHVLVGDYYGRPYGSKGKIEIG